MGNGEFSEVDLHDVIIDGRPILRDQPVQPRIPGTKRAGGERSYSFDESPRTLTLSRKGRGEDKSHPCGRLQQNDVVLLLRISRFHLQRHRLGDVV